MQKEIQPEIDSKLNQVILLAQQKTTELVAQRTMLEKENKSLEETFTRLLESYQTEEQDFQNNTDLLEQVNCKNNICENDIQVLGSTLANYLNQIEECKNDNNQLQDEYNQQYTKLVADVEQKKIEENEINNMRISELQQMENEIKDLQIQIQNIENYINSQKDLAEEMYNNEFQSLNTFQHKTNFLTQFLDKFSIQKEENQPSENQSQQEFSMGAQDEENFSDFNILENEQIKGVIQIDQKKPGKKNKQNYTKQAISSNVEHFEDANISDVD